MVTIYKYIHMYTVCIRRDMYEKRSEKRVNAFLTTRLPRNAKFSHRALCSIESRLKRGERSLKEKKKEDK